LYTITLNAATIEVFCILVPLLHICDIPSHHYIFLCLIPSIRWPKRPKHVEVLLRVITVYIYIYIYKDKAIPLQVGQALRVPEN
jgi:hypothetical protein